MRADLHAAPKPRIKEVIVVEGRDDTAAVLRAVDCLTIETHGYGIRPETWKRIARVYEDPGIVIFTDPDHAGREIRRAIRARFPDAASANLTVSQAEKDGDIGIENAGPEDILRALARVCTIEYPEEAGAPAGQGAPGSVAGQTAPGSAAGQGAPAGDKPRHAVPEDLEELGLVGQPDSAARRAKAGAALGIGFCNGRALAKRVAALGITREELEKALKG